MTEPNTTWAQPEGGDPSPTPAPAPASPSPIAGPRKKGGGLTNALLLLAVLIAVGGIAFAGGRVTAPSAAAGAQGRNGTAGFPTRSFEPGASFQPGQGGPGGFGDRSMTISGTVKSIAGSTLVVTTASGNETTIDVSGSTYHRQAAATAADVTVGATVSVSVTGFGGFGRPGSSAAPDASAGPAGGSITATDVTITSK